MKKLTRRNPVAHFARHSNKSQVHKDRKKAEKRGYQRCKKSRVWNDSKAA